ncbi:MAG: VWA domain-containing protein [Bacteroidetes bacterium]|nr:VWA domain-containing protein [Bacteroidota bacterium]
MEEFGYLRGLDELLPEDFTAVFEIARVLEDPDSPLFRSIESVMTVSAIVEPKREPASREWVPNRNVTHGEEYEAALMQNISDIKRIFPHQYLLPDEVFMHRLATRSLWINVPRTPVIIPFGSSGSDYSPNNFKQKVYLLLDTSTSMTSHHRFQMAKAVTYVFLKRNLRELGHIYLRTFDTDLGPLQTATDSSGLWSLIRYVMRLSRLGNGTVMERAILQAADDIRAQSTLSGAEILMVTDGACHLDVEKIRSALGDTIRINTIKIGNATIIPDDKLLHDLARRGSSAEQRNLVQLEEELRITRAQVSKTSSDKAVSLARRVEQVRSAITDKLKRSYGREIEELSSVFVNVNDISSDAIFTLRESEIEEIRELLAEVEEDFQEGIDADALREAALLYEHVQMLLKSGGSESQMRQLQEMANRLNELLKDVLSASTAIDSATSRLSRTDIHDLHMMLGMRSSQSGQSLLALLLSVLRRSIGRIFGTRRGQRS